MSYLPYLLFVPLAAALGVHLAVPRLKAPSKALLMPLLLLFYGLSAERIDPWIVAALVAATAGDLLLLKPDAPVRFLEGLAAFLVGHVLWGVALLRSTGWLAGVPAVFALVALPYAAVAGVVLWRLWRFLGDRKPAFVVYCLAIAGMSAMALARVFTQSGAAFWLPFAGSLLFLFSDGMLAFHVFRAKVKNGDLLVMASYVAAQSLLVVGMLAG